MDIESNKKQNRKMTIFAIILSIVSIGLLVFGFILVSSDKVVMLQSISNLVSKLDNSDDDSLLSDKLANSNDIGLHTTLNIKSGDMSTNFILDYLENKLDKKSKIDLDVSYNNEDLLGLDVAFANNKGYVFVDDITPRYYYTEVEYTSIYNGLESDDYDKVMSLIKDAITDYINNDDIEKQKVEIFYNGKNKKVNKLTYKITNKVVKEVVSNFIESLKKDKKLVTNLASSMDLTEEEMVVTLDELLDVLSYEKEEIYCYYHVYYYGFNKIVQYELEGVNSEFLVQYKIDKKEIISLFDKENQVFKLEVNKNKKQYDFNGFIVDGDYNKYNFNGNVNDNQFTIILEQGDIDYKLFFITSKQETDNNFNYKNNIVVSSIQDKQETKLLEVDFNYEYYFNQKVTVDLSDSVNASEITEEDLTIIQNNVMNHPIYQLIVGLTSNLEISL